MARGQEAPQRWSRPAIAFHWLAATLIVAMLAIGLMMTHAITSSGLRFDLYQFHKSLGFCVLAVMLCRALWRLLDQAPAPVPGMSAWQARLAQAMHGALYLTVFGMILAGWLNVSTTPLPLPTRFFGLFTVPNIARPNAGLSMQAATVHAWLAYLLIGLIALHAAAALKHHLIDRDGVLRRMLPFQ